MRRVVLVHGAATDSRVWAATAAALRGPVEVLCPDRPQSGDLDTEIAFLAPLCEGALVVGVSGGATLGLELAARGVPIEGAVLHEPAGGSLAPGMLDHVAEGLRTGGVAGFGRALYGPAWNPSRTTATRETVAAEFAMFGAFEPAPLGEHAARVTLTVGEHSPPSRHRCVRALCEHLGTRQRVLPGVGHAVHLENGAALSALVPTG
ncbi:alpha/beta fold hydrolase [Prauserella cavernicola]|uniref:Alpha/beta hydrolase n=1 Tax=Prauserella cavernicola TaxID=2800127 RepID=A0A934R1M7_9PSEU|nr:alpha/beta hydrolase [Prauserella cavernicola]MBK1789224.1 alpha/beta hydrolase [Prauserella cavernicola]